MNLSKINEIALCKDNLPIKRLCEVEIGKIFTVSSIRKIATKFGDKVVVDLNNEFTSYLPARVNNFLLKDNSEELEKVINNLKIKPLKFIYHGGKINACEFLDI